MLCHIVRSKEIPPVKFDISKDGCKLQPVTETDANTLEFSLAPYCQILHIFNNLVHNLEELKM